jgi:flavodoxin II
MNIGLFYGSSTCYTEMAAEKIRDIIGPELVTLHNLKDDAVALMEQYDVLILGIPTWDFGEIQEDWEAIWDQLDTLNLDGKIVALYGMGDQLGYGEWFLDALGMLHDKLAPKASLSATGQPKATSSPAKTDYRRWPAVCWPRAG